MAIIKGKVKDALGNELHSATSADIVVRGDSNVDAALTAVEGRAATLEGSMTTAQGDITTLQGNMTTAQGDIDTLEGKVSALEGAVAGQSGCYVVDDIAARDALTESNVGDQCWVKDASADETVESGAAKYLWDGTAWVKTAEAESMDVVIDWADVQNKVVDSAVVENGVTPENLATTGFYFEKDAVAAG